MISQGISAPSTALVASACGRSGTGIVTGVAPIASTTALPVGPGTRSFLPAVSATVRTGSVAIWIAWPAWTWLKSTCTSSYSGARYSSNMSRIARLVAVMSLVKIVGSSKTSERGKSPGV